MLKSLIQAECLESVVLDVLVLKEAFNSTFDSISWEHVGAQYVGTAVLKQSIFQLFIEPIQVDCDNDDYTCLNIAFGKLIHGKISQDLIKSTPNASAVLGAVSKALAEKVSELKTSMNVVAACFFAKKGEEKRLNVYRSLLLNPYLGLSEWTYHSTIEAANAVGLLAISDVNSKIVDKIISQLVRLGKLESV